jgi:hypothetical protein
MQNTIAQIHFQGIITKRSYIEREIIAYAAKVIIFSIAFNCKPLGIKVIS